MCKQFDKMLADEYESGMEKGIVSNIKSLMETLNLTLIQAKDALKLSEEDKVRYMKLMA